MWTRWICTDAICLAFAPHEFSATLKLSLSLASVGRRAAHRCGQRIPHRARSFGFRYIDATLMAVSIFASRRR
jgi:hypothetical protein